MGPWGGGGGSAVFLFLPVRKEKGAWAGQGVNDELRGECDFIQDKLGEKTTKHSRALKSARRALKRLGHRGPRSVQG